MKPKFEISQNSRTGRLEALYIRIKDAAVARSVVVDDESDPGLVVDLDRKGELVGVEVLAQDYLAEFCRMIAKELPKGLRSELQKACQAS